MWAAFTANLVIAAAKCVAALITGSVSLLAEAAHSLADTSKQLLLFLGRRRAARDADPEHPLGYGSERYFWAFLVAVLLFPLGAVWAAIEAFEALGDPQPIAHPLLAAGVLVVAVVAEALSLRVAVREIRRKEPQRSLWHFVRRSRDPDLPSVLLEDTAAVLGGLLALGCLGLAQWTGDTRWDAVGGLAIAALLLGVAAVLSIEFKSLLVGESALPEVQRHIEHVICGHPSVCALRELRTLHLSPDRLLVLAQVTLDGDLPLREASAILDSLRERVRDAVPMKVWVRIEPAV